MQKNVFVVALVVVFVMALSVPVLAMTHTATYEMEGIIAYQKQTGHLCNTGAEYKQTITGSGEMSKVQNVAMVPGKITVDDTNDYVAGETSLTVTSVIELCAPPKYELDGVPLDELLDRPYDGPDPYNEGLQELTWREFIAIWLRIIDPPNGPLNDNGMDQVEIDMDIVNRFIDHIEDEIEYIKSEIARLEEEGASESEIDAEKEWLEVYEELLSAINALLASAGDKAVVHPSAMYRDLDQPHTYYGADGWGGTESYKDADSYNNWEAVSDQIWAVQVAADPGFSGNLHQDFIAAYGPYEGRAYDQLDADDDYAPDDDYWAWENSDWDIIVGSDYVGNYFNIDQTARTSMGTVQRYIDISSPFSHGYLMEDMSVVGESEITEAFEMTNISPGADVPGLWYDLF